MNFVRIVLNLPSWIQHLFCQYHMEIDFRNYTKMKGWGKSHRSIYYCPHIPWDKVIPVIFRKKMDKQNITTSLHEPMFYRKHSIYRGIFLTMFIKCLKTNFFKARMKDLVIYFTASDLKSGLGFFRQLNVFPTKLEKLELHLFKIISISASFTFCCIL